jgi:predicted TIM-barrel fold metal-dependent hydrolase
MIIDSHGHLYPEVGALGDWDFEDEEEARRSHQRASYVFRRVGRRSDTGVDDPDSWKLLWDAQRVESWDGLLDVGFHLEGNDFVWEHGGVTYTAPGRPGSDPLLFLSLMDACGVDAAVIQNPLPINRFAARMVRAYPGRFLPLALIDESEYATDKGMQQLHEAVEVLGMKGVYHNPHPGWDCFENFDSPRYTPFWREVARLGLPVWCLGSALQEHFPDILVKLRRWIDAVPELTRIQVHGFPPHVYLDGDQVRVPEMVKDIVSRENFYLEILPLAMGYYTHPRSHDVVHALYDAFGGTKFVWGSEFIKAAFPHTKEHYAEMLGHFDTVYTYMSTADAALIKGENLRRIFQLP